MFDFATTALTIDGIPVKKFVFDRITGKKIRKAIMRGNDCAKFEIIERAKALMDSEEPPYFARRRKTILKEFMRRSRFLRAKMTAKGITIGTAGVPTRAAPALEAGGKYGQFVKEHERMQTTFPVSARGSKGFAIVRMDEPQKVRVKYFNRERTEDGKHYIERALNAALPIITVPTERLLRELFLTGEVPSSQQVRSGL